MNHIVLSGRLVTDAEHHATPNDHRVTAFSLAVPYRRYGAEDDAEAAADFFEILCWDRLADACQHLLQGSRVLVEGKLRIRGWEDVTGQRRKRPEIHARTVEFLDPKKREAVTVSADADGHVPF